MAFNFRCSQCGFESIGWATQDGADQTAQLHAQEHETGEAMPELADRRTQEM